MCSRVMRYERQTLMDALVYDLVTFGTTMWKPWTTLYRQKVDFQLFDSKLLKTSFYIFEMFNEICNTAKFSSMHYSQVVAGDTNLILL